MKASKSNRKVSSGTVTTAVVFLVVGVVSLVLAFIENSEVLALVGLGLTFWGALFLLIAPLGYVESSLLETVALPGYQVIDRVLQGSKTARKAYYIPSYPKDVYLPDHLKGLKDTVAFIPNSESSERPAIQEMAEGKIYVHNPEGALVTPPGVSLLAQLESKTRIDLTKMKIEELVESLPKLILENLTVAKEIKLVQNQNQIDLTITESPFLDLFSKENNLRSIGLLGCPIASAVACAITKITGKRVAVTSLKVIPETKTEHVTYDVIEG
jgi:hypothetical protein